MYVDVLSSALGAWSHELGGDMLVNYVLGCRARMLTVGPVQNAEEALAAEVAYDRALIQLCVDVGIAATPAGFDQPQAERLRLERTLASEVDVDLVALSRARLDVEGPVPPHDPAAWPQQ
jgi:hypothetical protein